MNDDDFGKLIAAAVVVGGVALLVAAATAKSQHENTRATFQLSLGETVAATGWTLVAANLGIDRLGSHFWDVTLRDRCDRLWSVRVPLLPGTPPYHQSALQPHQPQGATGGMTRPTVGSSEVEHALDQVRDAVTRVIRAEQLRDRLTGLANDESLTEWLAERVDKAEVHSWVAFIEVDRFKSINDRYGYAMADELLKRIAGRLQAAAKAWTGSAPRSIACASASSTWSRCAARSALAG